MRVLVVTGTGTGVGKTVATAAVAALAAAAGERVVVVKPAQTGVGPDEPGDLADVRRLAGPVGTLELARFPEPLAPATAARRAGAAPLAPSTVVEAVRRIDADLVLVEGAGGLLVRLDDDVGSYPDDPDLAERTNLADLPVVTGAPLLGVLPAGLGTATRADVATAARCGLGPVLGGRWSPGPSG